MNNQIIIRKGELKDAKRIAGLNMLLAKETEDKELDNEVVLQGVKTLLDDSSRGFYFIAEKTGRYSKIVGQVLITFEWSDWRNKYFWWVQSVYVDKDYRKKKIFTNLFQYIIQLAESKDDVYGLRLYVKENNDSAKRVYEILGMRRTSYELYEMEL